MMLKQVLIEKRVKISGLLILIGIFAELITLFWSHPISFLMFILIGGLSILFGVGYYLISLVTIRESE